MSRTKKAARSLVRLFFRERLETFTGVLNHDNAQEAGPYGLIKYNPREHVMDDLFRILFRRYTDSRVFQHTGITWDRFYHELEYWETEELIELCQELSRRDTRDAENLHNEAMRLENSTKSKK